jgi:hypothetical protein
MLFDTPFIADGEKIGEHRQRLTDCDARENKGRIDYDYKLCQKVLVQINSAKQNLGISKTLG